MTNDEKAECWDQLKVACFKLSNERGLFGKTSRAELSQAFLGLMAWLEQSVLSESGRKTPTTKGPAWQMTDKPQQVPAQPDKKDQYLR